MTTCENCGCRVYKLGCVNCNEIAYIEEQDVLTDLYASDQSSPRPRAPEGAKSMGTITIDKATGAETWTPRAPEGTGDDD